MVKVKKQQLRKEFFQCLPDCCDNYTIELIKLLVVEYTKGGAVKLPRSIEDSDIEIDHFTSQLLDNVRRNWFELYYFDIALNYLKSRNIKDCIEKDKYELRKLIRHILWCRLKEQKINKVENFTGDEISLVFRFHSVIEQQLRRFLDIKFQQPVSVVWQYNKVPASDVLNDFFEGNIKKTIINIIWDCLQIEKDEKKKNQEGYQYLCANIKNKLWNIFSDTSKEKFISKLQKIEISIPAGDQRNRVVLAFVFLITIEKLLYIRQYIRKYGAFVYLIKTKDSTLYNCIFNHKYNHPAYCFDIDQLIYSVLKKRKIGTTSPKDILHEIITTLLLGKIDEYMFIQSLKSYIYTIVQRYVKNERYIDVDIDIDNCEILSDDNRIDKVEKITLYDLIWECSVMNDSFNNFDQYITEFITRASPQRKAPELKKRIVFDIINDNELFEEFKDNKDPLYHFKNVKNIKTIRNRIRKSLKDHFILLKDPGKGMATMAQILTEHLNSIEYKIIDELTAPPLLELTNIQTRSVILESRESVTRLAQYSFLMKVMRQTKILFGDTDFAADFWEEILPDIPLMQDSKEIILREFRAYRGD